MEVTKDLQKALVNDMAVINNIVIEYIDGEILEGFIKSVQPSPVRVKFCKRTTRRGENSYCFIDFSKVAKISLEYHNGKIVCYP